MYPDVANGWGTWVAWLDGEMSDYTEDEKRGDVERIKVRESGESGTGVFAHAWMCTIMYINHILLISVAEVVIFKSPM